MNFNRKSNENYISSKSGDFARQGVLLNKTLNIMEICTPKGYTHTS